MKKSITILLICVFLCTILSSCGSASSTPAYVGNYLSKYQTGMSSCETILTIDKDNNFTFIVIKNTEVYNYSTGHYDTTQSQTTYSGTIEFNSKTNMGYFTFDDNSISNASIPYCFSVNDSGNISVLFDSVNSSPTYDSYKNILYSYHQHMLFEKQSETTTETTAK